MMLNKASCICLSLIRLQNGARDDTKPGPRSVTINDTVSRFSSVPSKSRTQPSAEQAQRIAKIFSQRFA